MSSANEEEKFILSDASIAMIATKTDRIREYDIKRIAKLHSISEDDWNKIMEAYRDPTSSSKEAKIEALLRYLNQKRDVVAIIGFVQNLMNENSGYLHLNDYEEINHHLIRDGFKFDLGTSRLLPLTEMPSKSLPEEITTLEKKLKEIGFSQSLSELQGGLNAIPTGDKVGIITRFRRFLEELHKEIIIGLGENLRTSPVENRKYVEELLEFYNPLNKPKSNFRLIIDGIYGMLSELGGHPPVIASMEELLFLVHGTIEVASILVFLFEKKKT